MDHLLRWKGGQIMMHSWHAPATCLRLTDTVGCLSGRYLAIASGNGKVVSRVHFKSSLARGLVL